MQALLKGVIYMMNRVDLNSDMGESFGVYKLGLDEEVIKFISSANIACGFHAGDPVVMDYTVKLAKQNGVGIGAHPSFPDLSGFGRRKIEFDPDELEKYIIYQIGALMAFCLGNGAELQHVKAHGSLNNMASTDEKLAMAIATAIKKVDRNLIFVAPACSSMYKAGKEAGIKVASEVFADRAYNPDGTLVSRKLTGAVIKDPDKAAERAIKMIKDCRITAVDGSEFEVEVDTICVHGDNPEAINLVKKIREELRKEDIRVMPMREFIK